MPQSSPNNSMNCDEATMKLCSTLSYYVVQEGLQARVVLSRILKMEPLYLFSYANYLRMNLKRTEIVEHES
jgi:hypothetical protein